MWAKLSTNKLALSLVSGIFVVLAFPPIEWVPLIIVFPFLFSVLCSQLLNFWRSFWYGFLTSLVFMIGGFYWVTYVIHVFGYVPWAAAVVGYLIFCGFGALNFPIFTGIVGWFHARLRPNSLRPWQQWAWYAVALPGLFTFIEYLIPKLFPWYISHSLYQTLWLIQVVDFTGVTFLSFVLCCLGGSLYVATLRQIVWWKCVALPVGLILFCIVYSAGRLQSPMPRAGKQMRVALIQANIGSLEKVKARANVSGMVEYVMSRYKKISEEAMTLDPKPDLLVWPETAMPFRVDSLGAWSWDIRTWVMKWKTPLLTGGYTKSTEPYKTDYNAGFLLEPSSRKIAKQQIYRKSILLAFGEYMPFGDDFPWLYRAFPQVSNFARGNEQNLLVMEDGTRIGVNICYEAIVPSYYRKILKEGPHLAINLTNDSWFGPTSEPYQHGALSVFRAIESRVPMLRATNTGISFAVDAYGHLSRRTGVYEEGKVITNVELADPNFRSVYTLLGDWFVAICINLFVWIFLFINRRPLRAYIPWKNNAPVPD